jgi:hypothetical protein
VFAIPELPPGHSRESLIHIFNDVLKDMGSSSNNSSNDANSGSMKFSNHSAHWTSPASGPPVDLLSDEFFGPDDFDRYLGCASLKPLPAFPADRRRQQHSEADYSDSRENILIELDIESPRLSPTSTTLPNLSNSHSPVDELFFGSTANLRVRSFLSPSHSPPLHPPRCSTSTPSTLPSLSDSGRPSIDDLYFGSTIEVGVQSLLSIHQSQPRSSPTPPSLSNSRPPSFDELFFGGSLSVDSQIQPLHLTQLQAPPSQSQEINEVLKSSFWPKPLVFQESPYPVFQSAQVRGHQQTLHTDVDAHTLSRRHGSEDLRVQANIQLTVTVPTSRSSPTAQNQHKCAPTCLQAGHSIPRKPVAPSPMKQIEYTDEWRDYSPLTEVAGSPYQAFASRGVRAAPSLPLIPSVSSTSLMEEMKDELDRLMDEWNMQTFRFEEGRVPAEDRWSLLDMPIDEPSEIDLPPLFEPIAPKPKASIKSVNSEAGMFRNVTRLLTRPEKWLRAAEEPFAIGEAAALKCDTIEIPPTQSNSLHVEEPTATESRSQMLDDADRPPTSLPLTAEPSPTLLVGQTPKWLPKSNNAPIVPPRSSSRTTQVLSHPTIADNQVPQTLPNSNSFRSRMNKATIDALLSASNESEFQRAFSIAKKTKQESMTNLKREFEWHRWVDRDYEDTSAAVKRAMKERRRRGQQARKWKEESAGTGSGENRGQRCQEKEQFV